MIYGPNTAAVCSILARTGTLTVEELRLLNTAASYAGPAWSRLQFASEAAGWASWYAGRYEAEKAAMNAAEHAASSEAWVAARGIIVHSAWFAVRFAIDATITYDLATTDGPYTIFLRDVLLAPWVSVCGMPAGLEPSDL